MPPDGGAGTASRTREAVAGVLEVPERLCAVQRLKLTAVISNLPPGVPIAVGMAAC